MLSAVYLIAFGAVISPLSDYIILHYDNEAIDSNSQIVELFFGPVFFRHLQFPMIVVLRGVLYLLHDRRFAPSWCILGIIARMKAAILDAAAGGTDAGETAADAWRQVSLTARGRAIAHVCLGRLLLLTCQ